MFIVEYLVLYLSYISIFLFSSVCFAAGLYYIAELVEEYTILTKKIIRITIISIIGIHLLMSVFEDFPLTYILIGIAAHCSYFFLLRDFPFIDLWDIKFILSAISVIVDHFAWFYYFSWNYMEFNQILAFFVICVWMVPFIYFISLSANESALPYGVVNAEVTAEDFSYYPTGGKVKRGKRTSTFLSFFNWLKAKKEQWFPNLGSNSQKLF